MSSGRSKVRLILWIVIGVLLCTLVGGAAYCYFCWQVPYLEAQNTMPADGIMTMWEQEDGSLLLTWPEGTNADSYTLEVLTDQGQSLYSYATNGCSGVLPASLPRDVELTVQVTSCGLWRDRVRPGDRALTVKTLLAPPKLSNLTWTVDPETDTARIRFDSRSDTYYNMYMAATGEPVLLETLEKGQATLAFGEGADWPVPEFGSTYTLLFDAVREISGLTFYGNVSASLELSREDFLGTALQLQCNDLGNNAWQLFWSETKGDHYEVQQWAGDDWKTVATVAQDAELTYHTGHMAKFKDFSFRVIAVGGQAEDIHSEPVQMHTGVAAVYSTIWPQKKLEVYADETRTQVLGQVEAGTALCVLEEKEGLFGVRFGDGVGYLDSNYCMINLPEYMEDLCWYNITNSHHSIYMVHDYEIPEVTDTVIKGYEDVELKEGHYLVPLLYPAAKKLVAAAYSAREQGYVLKIYDSFRPRKATLSIYDLTEKIISDPIPEWTFAEKKERLEQGLPVEPTEPPTQETTEATESPGATDATGGTGPQITPSETVQPTTEELLTYEKLMTDNGRYYLGNFLAYGTSNHNRGIALDLTLVSLRTGEEVKMQTAIHDLSWHSESKLNKEPAKKLQSIMVAAGFGGLDSEWWHYQDNDAKKSLELEATQNGINAQCWMADDNGWRYRDKNGRYYVNCQKTVDGVTYTFDEAGYVIENG